MDLRRVIEGLVLKYTRTTKKSGVGILKTGQIRLTSYGLDGRVRARHRGLYRTGGGWVWRDPVYRTGGSTSTGQGKTLVMD